MSSIQSHPTTYPHHQPSDQSNPSNPSPPRPQSPSTTTTNQNINQNITTNPSDPPKETSEAQTAFTETLRSVGQNHETQIRDRVRTLQSNAPVLQKQGAEVQRATEALRTQNDSLAKVADTARTGLKEIGDVQNWAELIERDLLVVEETVRLAEEREERERRERRERGEDVEDGDGDGDAKGKGKKKGWLWW